MVACVLLLGTVSRVLLARASISIAVVEGARNRAVEGERSRAARALSPAAATTIYSQCGREACSASSSGSHHAVPGEWRCQGGVVPDEGPTHPFTAKPRKRQRYSSGSSKLYE